MDLVFHMLSLVIRDFLLVREGSESLLPLYRGMSLVSRPPGFHRGTALLSCEDASLAFVKSIAMRFGLLSRYRRAVYQD